MIDKFERNKNFLLKSWEDFFTIASISENNNLHTENANENQRMNTEEWNLLKMLGNNDPYKKVEIISKEEFCFDVSDKIVDVKLYCLSCSQPIYCHMCQHPFFSQNITDQKLNLYKLFLINTKSDKVIFKTNKILEKIKEKFVFSFKNIYLFNSEIEEILLVKKSDFIKDISKNNQENKTKLKKEVLEVPSPYLNSPSKYQIQDLEMNINNKSISNFSNDESNRNEKYDKLVQKMDKWLCQKG